MDGWMDGCMDAWMDGLIRKLVLGFDPCILKFIIHDTELTN